MVNILARILDSERNFNGSADPMITADRGFIQFWGLDFGFCLLGSSDRGSQRSPGNLTFSLFYAGCHAVEKMTKNSNALERNRSVMAVMKLASYPRGPSYQSLTLLQSSPTKIPIILRVFQRRLGTSQGQSSNHHERVGTCRYQDRFHSVVTSCRLSTLCCRVNIIIAHGYYTLLFFIRIFWVFLFFCLFKA